MYKYKKLRSQEIPNISYKSDYNLKETITLTNKGICAFNNICCKCSVENFNSVKIVDKMF